MKDLIVQRYNIVTVHSNGETFDDLREKPNGMFCYYKEANEYHKEILAEYSEPVNEELLEALQETVYRIDVFISTGKATELDIVAAQKARAAISKALGEE
ncbi:hypothetical protein FNN84_11160 [Salmonella enterica subsp. salamae]|uniref:Uncharacterized protein n=1 Tax=Salmonella enterica subsp. salamae TaxID=59202 RepID=A0A5Y2S0V0_SALER|nr:hypothetical protein [Salmonella enterica subsp. salamae]ECJ2312757.1 hypothetical protein [Salmonella enterica subsp. salamae]EDU0615324.1 hypothetical protein [Salmonella enterica subsp. salamae]